MASSTQSSTHALSAPRAKANSGDCLPHELLDLFGGFRILCYQEGKFFVDGKESFRAELLGQKKPGARASL